jgi:peptidoglycan/xylan/chitin deacetylase (PgdA/CDA1 family)
VCAIVAATALLLTACVAEPGPATSPHPLPSSSPPASHAAVDPAPEFRVIDGVDIPGLRTVTDGDNGSLVYAVIPQIDGYDTINDRIHGIVESGEAELAAQDDSTENVRGFVNIGWRPLGSGSDVVGLLVSSVISPGASAAMREDSVWYDAVTDQLLGWRDFVAEDRRADIIQAVMRELRRTIPYADLASAAEILRSGDPAVGFSAEGALIVGFDEYDVAPGSEGAPMIEVPVPTSWLSSVGVRARQATLEPNPLVVTPPPPPAPEPDVDCRSQRCVALTFDDGPSGRTTPRLLDVLADADVPATFFVLGAQAQAYPKLVRRIAAEGHEIGNHSWSHPDLTRMPIGSARKQIDRTSRVIEKITGQRPVLLRPPYGARNKKVDALARSQGYSEVLWSIDTRDWENHSPKKILAAAKKARRGAIILMHDIHADTVDAVPAVIAALRKKGFTLVTVSDLLGSVKPGKRYYGRY